MWVAILVLGIILGAFGYALLGLVWLANKILTNKSESKPEGIAAVGVEMHSHIQAEPIFKVPGRRL
jgi:hypothetical protein